MTVRWGVLGAAKFAQDHMARAIHAAEGAALTALATSSPEKAAGFQSYAPDLQVFGSYDDLLTSDQIDAVYIPLPNHLHVDWTLKAIEAGKHVLTEKPIALQASDIERLIAARDRSGLCIAEAYMIVHHPQWKHAKNLYDQGLIGELKHVEGVFTYNNASDPGNIRNRAETGGGGIPDIGVYTYGSTTYLTGRTPEEIVHADVTFENDVDVISRISARYQGFTAHWLNSMRMANAQQMMFLGTEGTITLTAPFNAGVYDQAEVVLQRGMTREVARFPGVNHYILQVEAFCRWVEEGAPFAWQLEDAMATQQVIDAIFAKVRKA